MNYYHFTVCCYCVMYVQVYVIIIIRCEFEARLSLTSFGILCFHLRPTVRFVLLVD